MKTITLKDKTSVYVFEDQDNLFLDSNKIIVGEPAKLIIADLNINNCIVYEGINIPDDWKANRYLFDGVIWSVK